MLGALSAEIDDARWGWNEELLATLVEVVHELLRFTIAANTKKGTRLPAQLHIPRPAERREAVEDLEVPRVTRHTFRHALMRGGRPDGL